MYILGLKYCLLSKFLSIHFSVVIFHLNSQKSKDTRKKDGTLDPTTTYTNCYELLPNKSSFHGTSHGNISRHENMKEQEHPTSDFFPSIFQANLKSIIK